MTSDTKESYNYEVSSLKKSGWTEYVGKDYWGGYNWSHKDCGPALYQFADAVKINSEMERK